MSFYRDYNDKVVFDYWNNRSLPVFNTIGIEQVSRAGGAEVTGVHATHSGLEGWTNGYGEEPDPGQKFAESNHPVVIKHPVTGRKHLFISRAFTTVIPMLTRVESASILDLLNKHIETNQAFQYRVRWEPDTVLLWDNYGTQHLAIWDYYPFERWGERVSAINGVPPSNS